MATEQELESQLSELAEHLYKAENTKDGSPENLAKQRAITLAKSPICKQYHTKEAMGLIEDLKELLKQTTFSLKDMRYSKEILKLEAIRRLTTKAEVFLNNI